MLLTQKPKAEVLSPRNAMALDTLAGVRGEMARLYRLGLSERAIAGQAGWSVRSVEAMLDIYAHRSLTALAEVEALYARSEGVTETRR